MHETEAWLLSDPDIFPPGIKEDLPESSAPERINFQARPSGLLKDLHWRRLRKKYKKPTDGAKLLRKLDPDLACSRCPHLKLLLDDILKLIQQELHQ